MKPVKFVCALLLCAVAVAFAPASKKDHWKELFNGKDLSGWDTYIGPDLDDNGKPITGTPIGLNNDPSMFLPLQKLMEKILFGYRGKTGGQSSQKTNMRTTIYNYNLNGGHFPGDKRKERKKIAGYCIILLENMGQIMGPGCVRQEFQIEEGNTGDYWGCAGGEADIPANKISETDYVYDPRGTLLKFSQQSKQSRHCIKKVMPKTHRDNGIRSICIAMAIPVYMW